MLSSDRDFADRSRYATTLRAPDPADATDAYVDLLTRQPHGVIDAPTTDASLEAVTEHHDALTAHHIISVTAVQVAQLFLDKLLTSEVAQQAGVPAPRTAMPETVDELDALAGELVYLRAW